VLVAAGAELAELLLEMFDTAGKFADHEVEVVDCLLLKRVTDLEVDEAGLEGAKLPFRARFVGHMCSLGEAAAAGNDRGALDGSGRDRRVGCLWGGLHR